MFFQFETSTDDIMLIYVVTMQKMSCDKCVACNVWECWNKRLRRNFRAEAKSGRINGNKQRNYRKGNGFITNSLRIWRRHFTQDP